MFVFCFCFVFIRFFGGKAKRSQCSEQVRQTCTDTYNSSFKIIIVTFFVCVWLHFKVLVLCNNNRWMHAGAYKERSKSNSLLEGIWPSKPQENASSVFIISSSTTCTVTVSSLKRHYYVIPNLQVYCKQSLMLIRFKGFSFLTTVSTAHTLFFIFQLLRPGCSSSCHRTEIRYTRE